MDAHVQEQKDVLLTADIGGTNCRFSLWQANIKADVVYDEVFTKVNQVVASVHQVPSGLCLSKTLMNALHG